MVKKKPYYAVRKGYKIGLFDDYKEASNAVNCYPNAEWKGFYTIKNATLYLDGCDIDEEKSKYWVVLRGRETGVFSDYKKVKELINKYSGSMIELFYDVIEAETYYEKFRLLEQQRLRQEQLEEDEQEGKEEYCCEGGEEESTEDKYVRRYYAVRRGRVRGIFDNYKEAVNSTSGYSGCKMKSFKLKDDAEQYMRERDEDEDSDYYTSDKCEDEPHTTIVYVAGVSLARHAGYGLFYGDDDSRNKSAPLKGEVQTTERAQLRSIVRALNLTVRSARSGKCNDLEIRTCWSMALKTIDMLMTVDRMGFKIDNNKKNADLIRDILLKKGLLEDNWKIHVKVEYIPRNIDNYGCQMAESFALKAARRFLL